MAYEFTIVKGQMEEYRTFQGVINMTRTATIRNARQVKCAGLTESPRPHPTRRHMLAAGILLVAACGGLTSAPASDAPESALVEQVQANVAVVHAEFSPLAGRLTGEIAAVGSEGSILLVDLRSGSPEALVAREEATVTIDRYGAVIGFTPGGLAEASLPAKEITGVERLPQGGLQVSTAYGGRLLIYPDGRLLRYNSLGRQILDAHVILTRG